MEGSIIHYDHSTFVKGRQKLIRKPEFKKAAVHRSAILEWRKDFVSHFSGYNAAALIFSATDPPEYLLASLRISIFPIQVCIYAAFIHIGDLFGRYVLDFFQVCCYFFLILLLVADCLFSLLSYTAEAHHECRFHCTQTPWPFPSDMRPDVPLHMLSAFPDQFFDSSGAVLSFPNLPFLSTAFPIPVSLIWIL